jgi:hypothetical protein
MPVEASRKYEKQDGQLYKHSTQGTASESATQVCIDKAIRVMVVLCDGTELQQKYQ